MKLYLMCEKCKCDGCKEHRPESIWDTNFKWMSLDKEEGLRQLSFFQKGNVDLDNDYRYRLFELEVTEVTLVKRSKRIEL